MMAASYFKIKTLKRKKDALQKNVAAFNSIKTKGLDNCQISENYQTKCRVCLLEGSKLIYSSISESIELFAGIKLSENDNFPKYICQSCYSLLQSAIVFRKKAQETNFKLLKQFTQNELPLINDAIVNEDKFSKNGNINDIDNSSNIRYKCTSCKITFHNYRDLMQHRKLKHKNIRIRCRICQRILTVQLYERHLARHQGGSHVVCEICGKLYRKDNLVRHLQLHSYDLPFKCDVCPYRGRFAVSLKLHMNIHTGLRPFTCDKCQLCFLTRSNLNRHILTHNKVRPHKCAECGRGFYTQKDLDLHFKSDHAGIKDFDCKFCGNKYGTKKALMRHELRIHKRDKMAKGRMPLYLQPQYKI